ncbi:hypothetical protein QQ045_024305 [Rhodiola kirilowii]
MLVCFFFCVLRLGDEWRWYWVGWLLHVHHAVEDYFAWLSLHPTKGHHQGDQLKVVFIQTQYINTDPMSFKSVVQSLTGKDSSFHVSCSNEATQVSPPSATKHVAPEDFSWPKFTPELLEDHFGTGPGTLMFDIQSSSRDFERLVFQLPPVEDWYHFWDNL